MASEIIWEKHGVLFRHSGTVTGEEVAKLNDIMYADPRFDSIRYQISDYTQVKKNLVGLSSARIIGTLDKSSASWNHSMLNIVITTDKDFIPVVDAYFKTLEGTGWECRIFTTPEEAYTWIHHQIRM